MQRGKISGMWVTRSVTGFMPTQSVGTINTRFGPQGVGMIARRFCPQGVGMIATRFCPEGVGGRLADDLPGLGSQSDGRGVPDLARAPDLTAATQQIVGKPASHALRAEAT
jgi:hypothetical protein